MRQIFIAAFLLSNFLSFGQDFDKAKMDSLFTLIEQNDKGMNSISIFKSGEEVYHNSIGFADVENKLPATKATKYRIGSISKTFTAAIIMKLVEEGKLGLDTKLSKFYPAITNAKKITIQQMLQHRSGIFNFTNAEDYPEWMEQPVSEKELMEKIKRYGSSFEPNSKAEYSNANYVLLSFIAEKITKKPYPELLENLICKPCKLSNTYYGGSITPDRDEAYSYKKLNKWEMATETDMSVPMGAGAIVSNPTDLNKFLNCLFQNKIVSKPILEKMMLLKDGFGIGMFQVPFYDRAAYGHTGGIDGFASNAFYFPEDSVSIAFTANGMVMPMNDIIVGILNIYFNKPYELPTFKKAIELKSKDLDHYLGIYSDPGFPLKLTISKKGDALFGQGTGQPQFPLEALGNHTFRFEPASLEIVFWPEENKLIFTQGGGTFELKKE